MKTNSARAEHIFGIIVLNSKQAVIFTLLGFCREDFLGYLHVEPVILPVCDKTNLSVIGLSDGDRVTSAAKLKVNDVFKTCCRTVRRISQNAVFQRYVSEVKFFPSFQNFFSPQIPAQRKSDGQDLFLVG